MENQEFIDKLSALAKDIIIFNSYGNKHKELTRKQELNAFYKIMRKHGIKQGKWNRNGSGRICNNFEWTLCLEAFKSIREKNNVLGDLMNKPPKDLLAYGEQQKKKINKK